MTDLEPERRRARAVLAGVAALIVIGIGVWWLARRSPAPAPPRAPGAPGKVTVAPAVVDFGESLVGSEGRTREVTVRNGSSSALRIGRVVVAGDDAAAFAPDAGACTRAAVAPGRSCRLRIRFVPVQRLGEGARSGTLSLETGAPDGPLTVALTGAAVAPSLETDHLRLDFGSQPVGARSPVQAVRVRNAGPAPVSLQVVPPRTSSDAGAGGAAEFPIISSGCPMDPTDRLAAGQVCTIAVAFQPAGPGGRSAILTVQAQVPGGSSEHASEAAGTVSVALAGVGAEPGAAPALVASSAEVDFQPVVPGAKSPVTTVTVSNTGGSKFQVRGVRVEGASAAEFAVAGTTCRAGSSLRPGGRCTVSLVFQPSGDAGAGSRSAMVVVDHAGPDGAEAAPPLTVALTGHGAVAVPAVARMREDFGAVPLGTATELRTLVLRNDGGVPLGVGALRLAGADAGDFVLAADRCSRTAVDPGRSCTFALGFDPGRDGGRSATLVVPHDAGPAPLTIALSGAGDPAADLSVAIVPPAGAAPAPGPSDLTAEPGRWRVVVRNAGPRDATGVRLVLSGEAVSLDPSSTGPWRCDRAERPSPRTTAVACTMPALPRGGRAVVDLAVDVSGDEGVPSLTAAVDAAEPDPHATDDRAHALVPIPGPARGAPQRARRA